MTGSGEPAVDRPLAGSASHEDQAHEQIQEREFLFLKRIGGMSAERGHSHRDRDRERRGAGEQARRQQQTADKLSEGGRPGKKLGRRESPWAGEAS